MENIVARTNWWSQGLGPIFWLGLALFALSFWLGSVRGVNDTLKSEEVPGYACAVWAFKLGTETMRENMLSGVCLWCAGLANAAMVAWLGLRLTRARWAWRRALAIAALTGSVPCSLLMILLMQMRPLQGYFAWVAGMVLMTANDWSREPRVQPAESI